MQVCISMPLHAPLQIEPSPAQAGRARGAPNTGLQAPALPGRSQAAHWPEQAESQQTPSTQELLAHSSARWQPEAKTSFGLQTYASQ